MWRTAEEIGIGRATLYQCFPDVEAILVPGHQRHVVGHLEHLAALRDQASDVREGLDAVLEVYALIAHRRGHHAADLRALLHRDEYVDRTQHQLHELIRDLLTEVAATDRLRGDVSPDELATRLPARSHCGR